MIPKKVVWKSSGLIFSLKDKTKYVQFEMQGYRLKMNLEFSEYCIERWNYYCFKAVHTSC